MKKKCQKCNKEIATLYLDKIKKKWVCYDCLHKT